ncbi:MAG: cupin domain-containing protein, partial [Spirochaetaceae bacterium]|nr:cupin domain-containing protein [Spirochaetaceae bacterium]
SAGIEAYRITLEAGARTGNDEYGHRGWELGVVESGGAELTVGNQRYTLEPGDSASFRSDSPHVLSNPGPGVLRMFWVISPPKGACTGRHGYPGGSLRVPQCTP